MRALTMSVTIVALSSTVCFGATTGVGASVSKAMKHPAVAHKAKKAGVPCAPFQCAPADEYFGPLKLSILGIRNQIHDLSLQYDVNHDASDAIFGKAKMAEASLKDWAQKYPTDPDLARHVYLLSHLYGKIPLSEAHERCSETQRWLLAKYSASWYARDERKRIAYRKEHPQNEITIR